MNFCSLEPTPLGGSCGQRRQVRPRVEQQERRNGGNLEAFAISFAKLVQIMEQVDIHKTIDVDVWVQGNSALADSKAEADALRSQLGYPDAGFDNDSGRAGCRIEL